MTVVLATSLSLLCLVTMWLLCRHRLPRSHTWRQKSARRVLLRLTDVRFNPAQKLTYLRALDPWVFEEVVVTALKRRGMAVEPSARYTGDGGADGRCWYSGYLVLLQMKRYSQHIDPQHVRAFHAHCEANKCLGWFVHTGRTGRRAHEAKQGRVEIISGDRLLALLDPKAPFEFAPPVHEASPGMARKSHLRLVR